MSINAKNMRIVIANRVRFAGNTQGLRRRVNWALRNRARRMNNSRLAQLTLVEPAAVAGFRTKK